MDMVDHTDSAAARSGSANLGTVRRTLIVLALPVLGEELLNSFVGLFDIFLAGRLGVEATSAVGLASYVAWLVTMLFMLVGTGTTALVARETGSGDKRAANHWANQSLGLAVGLGLVSCILMYLLAPVFGRLQSMSGEMYSVVVRYLRIETVAHVFTSVTLIGAAALRGVGDMRTPLKILATVNIVNVIASYALVYGTGPLPSMGIDGIVMGTVVGRVVGGLMTIWIFWRGRSGLRFSRFDLRPMWTSVRRILRIGLPAAVDGIILWSGHFVFLIVVANLGDGSSSAVYYAAHIIGVRVEALTYLPAVAWSKAAATMVGQALGARDEQRALRSGHEAVKQCGVLAIVLTAVYYFGAEVIYDLMQDDPQVGLVGVPAFKMVAFFQIFLITSIIYVGSLRGAGDTRYPMLITIVCILTVRLPVGYLFGIVLDLGLVGAWVGMCCDMTLRAFLAWLRFHRGRWVTTRI